MRAASGLQLDSTRRKFLKTTAAGVAGAALSQLPLGCATAPSSSTQIRSTPLGTSSMFLLTGAGSNVVAMADPSGSVAVDGGLAIHSASLLSAVSILPQAAPVATLFNTHWHPEQVGLNQRLGKAGATIIAHENTRLWLTTDITWPWQPDQTFQPLPKAAQPNRTFYDTDSLKIGNEQIDYGYLPQPHTDGDIYVFFRNANVLCAGGAVNGDGWSFIDWWTGGWINGVVASLEKLMDLSDDNTIIVPANGRLLDRKALQAQHAMYKTIAGRLRKILYSGKGPDDAVAEQPTKEYNIAMADDPEPFIRLAFQSLWGHMTPDA